MARFRLTRIPVQCWSCLRRRRIPTTLLPRGLFHRSGRGPRRVPSRVLRDALSHPWGHSARQPGHGTAQHTRPEVHPRIWPGRGFYEAYIESRALKDTGNITYQANFAPFGVSVASLQDLVYSPTTIPTFANYSDFCNTTPGGNVANGLGMADYSNRGFFTPAHNLDEGPSPTYNLPSNDPNSYTPTAFQSSDGTTWRYLDGRFQTRSVGPAAPFV